MPNSNLESELEAAQRNLEAVVATEANLQSSLAAAQSRAIQLQTERRRLSYDATQGNAEASAALTKANKASMTVDLETENIRSAIEEAKRRWNEAERLVEKAKQRIVAVQARALGVSLVERGRKIDESLAIVASEANGFAADIRALNQLGVWGLRVEQLTSLGERCLATALMDTPLKLRHLGYGERRDFTATAAAWAHNIDNHTGALLDNSEAA